MFSAVVIDPRAVMGVSHAIIRSLQVRPSMFSLVNSNYQIYFYGWKFLPIEFTDTLLSLFELFITIKLCTPVLFTVHSGYK